MLRFVFSTYVKITNLNQPIVQGLASGLLYIDDGESYEYQKNNYINIAFYYDGSVMKAK
jgi:hypothetical protein